MMINIRNEEPKDYRPTERRVPGTCMAKTLTSLSTSAHFTTSQNTKAKLLPR